MNTNKKMAVVFALSLLAISSGVYMLNISPEFSISNPGRIWLDAFSLMIAGVLGVGSVIANKFRAEAQSPLIDFVEIERRTDTFLDSVSKPLYILILSLMSIFTIVIGKYSIPILFGFGASLLVISFGLILWARLLKDE